MERLVDFSTNSSVVIISSDGIFSEDFPISSREDGGSDERFQARNP